MSQDFPKNVKVPIIEPHKDQRLTIDFIKVDGVDSIQFGYEPDFDVPVTPTQKAAAHIAAHIIKEFGLGEGTDNEQD